MRIVSVVLVSLSAVTTLIVCVFNLDWTAGLFGALGFLVWVMLPFVIATMGLRKHRNVVGNVCLILIAMACTAAAFIYVDGFYIHLDAQNGLLFLIIPLFQTLIVGLLFLIAAIFTNRFGSSKNDW